MWRYHFYNKSPIGRYFYKPLTGILWILVLIITGYNHVQKGEPQIFGLLVVITGFILFLISKISVIKKGKFLTFGASVAENTSKEMAICYYLGYFLMIVGFVMSFR